MIRLYKCIAVLAAALLLGCTAHAQTTTVTGTVVDPNGNPYASGTASAFRVVSTGQNPGVPVNVSTTATGSFSMPVPSPATYQFTICAPPVNIGPRSNPTPTQVCFSSGPIPISGGAVDISSSLPAAPLLGPGGGSITSVSSLPGGSGFYLATSCPSSTPSCFKIFADVQTDLNATFSAGSSTVVTSSQATPFSSTDVGKIIWGVANCGSGTTVLACTYNLPQGVITAVNGAHSVVSSTTAISNSSGSSNNLFWGHDDGAQIAAASAALFASALYGPGSSLTFPCGTMFTGIPPIIEPSSLTSVTFGISGCGGGGTVIMPLPKMNCTGGATFGCLIYTAPHSFGSVGVIQASGHIRDLVFYGGGLDVPDASATFTVGTSGVYINSADEIDNVWVLGWLWSNPSANPGITNSGGMMVNSGALSGGANACFLNGISLQPAQMFGGSCEGVNSQSVTVTSGTVSTHGIYIRPPNGFVTAISCINLGGTWYSAGDVVNGEFQSAAGITYFNGSEMNQNGGGVALIRQNGGVVHMQNMHTTSATMVISQTAGAIYDDCGNGPFNSTASTIVNLFGDCSITGTADVAGNHALTSGWGTANVNTVTGSTRDARFTISVTGGVPGANPVLTDTFAVPFLATPSGGCFIVQIGGTFGIITNPVPSSLTRTGVTWTFSGTPVSGQSYSFIRRCMHD